MVVSINNDERYLEQLESTVELFQERIAELEFAQEDLGWTRLGGDSSYEFSRQSLLSIIARSRLFFIQNPLLNRAILLQADYVWAQGVNIQGTNDLVNEVIQEFIDDIQNKREFTSHQSRLLKEQTLLIDGNVFFVLFTDKNDTGSVQIRSIIADEITEIVTNPDDANEIWFYKREWTSQGEQDKQFSYKQNTAYYPDIDYMPLNGKLPRTKNKFPVLWDAPILHVKTGMLAKSKFGVPETYSALDWAKAHSVMLQNWATIVAMFARYALKVTTPGNRQSILAAKNKLQTTVASGGNLGETNPATISGGVFIRNKDGVDIEPLKTSGATTSAEDSRQLRLMVASAMGLPDPMLSGEVDVGNLATAKTLDRPTELKFRSRQQLWTDVTLKILNWVVRWSIEAPSGLLSSKVRQTFDSRGKKIYKASNDPKTGKPMDLHVEVVFPPILERTIQERIDAVTSAVTLNGKTFAIDSPDLKKMTIRLMFQALGLNDVDELVQTIFDNISDAALKDNPNAPPAGTVNKPVPINV